MCGQSFTSSEERVSSRVLVGEEWANTVTHAVGLLCGIVGSGLLLMHVVQRGDLGRLLGCSVYAVTLVLVYTASTLSHAVNQPAWKNFFRVLDQGSIYLFIAGSYTPFAIAFLNHVWWNILLAMIWGVSLFGCISKFVFRHRVNDVSVMAYIALGWLPSIGLFFLFSRLPGGAVRWIVVGGICYTVGTIFLSMDQRVRHFHAIWHLCVVAGSTCHYLAILHYVAQA